MIIDPAKRPIYHITHLDNLPAILENDGLLSDLVIRETRTGPIIIGNDQIKNRRLTIHQVPCHRGTFVGHYVPFYFCPRSPMLYVIHKRNPQTLFKGGQEQIIHLVSTTGTAIDLSKDKPWAFSDRNAALSVASFFSDINELSSSINWRAVESVIWHQDGIKELKAAEFLVYEHFPWRGVDRIGVHNQAVLDQVASMLNGHPHQPEMAIRRDWYY